MYSKSRATAMILPLLLVAACSSVEPWRDEPVGTEVNVAFIIQKNLVVLPSVTIDGRPGRYLLGTAEQRTLLDPRFGAATRHALQLNEKEALRFTPQLVDLHGVADAIIGADVWGSNAIFIDYRAGLVTFQRTPIERAEMVVYGFPEAPMVNVTVNGRVLPAIVDTASPDTLILPRGSAPAARAKAHVVIAQTDFGDVDVRYADVTSARVGNRLLSKFLVAIDYGRKQVGLWRDPRIAL